MKRLLLLRHGQASTDSEGQKDFDRVLTAQGQSESKVIGSWILAQDLPPDASLVSEAKRATQTWDNLRKRIPGIAPAELLADLYLASPGTLLSQIEKLTNDIKTALLIGHNPGLETLGRLMSGPGSKKNAVNDLHLGLPPAGLAVIELNGETWRTMSAEGGRLTHFVRPGNLQKA
ncbi:MAG: histidine phosphatase family protein [Alphaproteobacteria bacterium]|nr:histidine phosphatase family protein [Alphaproteobacteria bacterium]